MAHESKRDRYIRLMTASLESDEMKIAHELFLTEEAAKEVVELLKAQPGTLQNLPKPNNTFEGWIPCSEPPILRGVYRVTVQCEHINGYPDYEVCYGEYDNGWYLFDEPVGQLKVVAWMPIEEVEPYQPREE